MPTRLLEIHAPNGARDKELLLRLVDLDPAVVVEYASLSYCWGSTQNFMLTSATHSSMLSNVCLDLLPRTVQETILLCSKLGIRYLWVDALCILQDSQPDWHTEAASMSTIYGNALVTIKAAASDNCHGGLISPRVLPNYTPAMLRCFAPGFIDMQHVIVQFLHVSTEREALETRAWTYQEDLLSPRTLTYGLKEMWWECNATMKSDGGRQVIESHFVSGLPKPLRTIRPTQYPKVQQDAMVAIRSNWFYILTEYVTRRITYPTDRLPALSGIAKVFQASLPEDKYLAGLWESQVPRNLLWHVSSPATDADKNNSAPSWSWGSVGQLQPGAYITFNSEPPMMDLCCKYLSSHIESRGIDLYGQVKSGTLVLNGPLLQAWRVCWPTHQSGHHHKLYEDGADYRYDRELENTLARRSPSQNFPKSRGFRYPILGKFHEDSILIDEEGNLTQVWLLFITALLVNRHPAIGVPSYGLVLEKSMSDVTTEATRITNKSLRAFRRIGIFSNAYCDIPASESIVLI